MNGIEQFIAEQIAGEMVRIKRISPMVKSYGSNARGFLESLEGEGWSIRDYNVCVRALAFIAEQNGCYNRSAEQAEVEEDPIRLLPWYQGKEKKPWFGPDNISNHSIEKTED